jgi:nucleoside-diphosphate-sugar epimerase
MTQSLVVGATGIVGGYILQHLTAAGERPFAVSRREHANTASVVWFQGELASLHSLGLPAIETLYCTANIGPLPNALRALRQPTLKRVVAFTSTSILTKIDSKIEAERTLLSQLATAEQELICACRELGIGYTILRPTLIYCEGRDANITRLARFIRRYGFVPLAGKGNGLRQPVHAEDLAIGAKAAAASSDAIDKVYSLSGSSNIPYHEMVGRIFDGMGRPRRVYAVPAFLWRAAFTIAGGLLPNANVAMGLRMNKDMVFDCSPAVKDFGWNPRPFHPRFDFPL